jgi:glyoxylase-like metal-dependent hydrolase (beta-lactamase superfamily II)
MLVMMVAIAAVRCERRRSMKVGTLEILPVFDSMAAFPPAQLYRLGGATAGRGLSEDDWRRHPDLLNADGQFELYLGGYLIRGAGDRIVLVDLGFGPEPFEPTADAIPPDFPTFSRGVMLESLGALGYRAEDVTDVVLTHLHYDHIGWSTVEGQAVFSRATYRCAAADWSHFFGSDRRVTRSLGPIEARFEQWDGDTTLASGIDLRMTPGHTPGSTTIVLSSGTERLVLLGDVVHCPVELLDVEWAGLGDVDPALALKTREALARELEGAQVTVGAAHFPGLAFGRLLRGQSERRWTYLDAGDDTIDAG